VPYFCGLTENVPPYSRAKKLGAALQTFSSLKGFFYFVSSDTGRGKGEEG